MSPRISRQTAHDGGKSCQSVATVAFSPHGTPLVLIAARGQVDTRTIVLTDGLPKKKKNLNKPIGNRNRDLPAYSAVTQPTARRYTPRRCKSIRNIAFHFTGKWTEQKGRTFMPLLSNNFKLCVEILELIVWGNTNSTSSDYLLIWCIHQFIHSFTYLSIPLSALLFIFSLLIN